MFISPKSQLPFTIKISFLKGRCIIAGVFANVGEVLALDLLLGVNNCTLRLFKSNTTPSASSVLGDFTTSTFTNYADVTLTKTSWGASSTVGGKGTSVYGTAPSWSVGSSENCYGYVVFQGSTLLYGERFTNAPLSLAAGYTLTLNNPNPTISLNSE